jgi:hypothetical protein
MAAVDPHAAISCRALLQRKHRTPVCLMSVTGRQGTTLHLSLSSIGAGLRRSKVYPCENSYSQYEQQADSAAVNLRFPPPNSLEGIQRSCL